MSLKNPLTPPGIYPGTVRIVAQRLNHFATPGPTTTTTTTTNNNNNTAAASVTTTTTTTAASVTTTTNTNMSAASVTTITTGFGEALEASLTGWQTGKVHFISLLVVIDNRGVYRLCRLRRDIIFVNWWTLMMHSGSVSLHFLCSPRLCVRSNTSLGTGIYPGSSESSNRPHLPYTSFMCSSCFFACFVE